MQAIPTRMSKQVNYVNNGPENLHRNPGKYNSLLTLLLLVKRTFIVHSNALLTMQELVKEVTLKKHSNNGVAILHGNKGFLPRT